MACSTPIDFAGPGQVPGDGRMRATEKQVNPNCDTQDKSRSPAPKAEQLQTEYPEKKFLLIGNKSDLRKASSPSILISSSTFHAISAKAGKGIDELRSWMEEQVLGNFDLANDTIVSNARHHDALTKTEASLQSAKNGLENDVSSDFVAMDIRQAMYQLGPITGDISSDEILGNIFSRFCIGK